MDYSVFDSLFDSVYVVDEDLKIVYCNEAAASLVGSSVRRLTRGIRLPDALQLQDPELFIMGSGTKGALAPLPMSEIGFAVKSSNRSGKIQLTVQPFVENAHKRWVAVMHDVTLEETLHKKYQGELEQKEIFIQQLKQAKDQLEEYSKNLEKMVESRTAELRSANQLLSAIMNSLGQGFLVFDRNGVCSNVYTKACEDVLEINPSGKFIWDVLKSPDKVQLKKWLDACFMEALPIDSMLELAPGQFNHSRGRFVTLSFYPIRNDEGKLANIVLVATDQTIQKEAELALAREKQYISFVLKVVKGRDQFSQYMKSTRSMLQTLKQLMSKGSRNLDFAEAFRLLHTIEGESGIFSVESLRLKSRECQETIEPMKNQTNPDRDRVYSDLVENLAELEIAFDDFIRDNRELLDVLHVGESRKVEIAEETLLEFANILARHQLPGLVRETFTEKLLKRPLTLSLKHYSEVAKHVASVQGKLLNAVTFDCDRVRIAPGALDQFLSSLVHAFRNAVDHGIEAPEERVNLGKPESGTIKVYAEEFLAKGQVKWIRLTIEDDGRGIDPAVIRRKVQEKNLVQNVLNLSDDEVIQAVFAPGFTSRDSIGAFSGRGIGMDAIKVEVERLSGRVRVSSTLGRGTKLTIEIPEPTANDDSFAMSA